MSNLEPQIREFILEELTPKLEALGIPRAEVTGDFDLVGSGVLDSLAFIEFVGAVEDRFKFEMDFEDLDPAEFTIMDGFLRCALENAKTA